MRTHPAWNYSHYLPLDCRKGPPYVRQLLPSENGVRFNWQPEDGSASAEAAVRLRSGGEIISRTVLPGEVSFEGLSAGNDYLLSLRTDGGETVRLFRTGVFPGQPVNYLHPDDPAYAFSGQYLCSPSICRAPDGAFLASMDVFAPDRPQNLTLLFRSEDGGASWQPAGEVFPCFWGSLFTHRGKLYLLGISTEYGDLLIGRSDDGGQSWSAPSVLFRGSSNPHAAGLHRAPMPVVEHGGRLWTEIDYGAWGVRSFANSLCSDDAEGDLLDPGSWLCTGFLSHDIRWPGAEDFPGAIEGNAVVLPDGEIGALLRYTPGKALLLRGSVSDPEAALRFEAFVPMPFAHTKFEVRRLPDGRYLAVGNPAPDRRTLSAAFSKDLRSWTDERVLIDGSGLDPAFDAHQYPDFLVEGDRLLVLSRTARNGAHNFHDSNCITFHTFML